MKTIDSDYQSPASSISVDFMVATIGFLLICLLNDLYFKLAIRSVYV